MQEQAENQATPLMQEQKIIPDAHRDGHLPRRTTARGIVVGNVRVMSPQVTNFVDMRLLDTNEVEKASGVKFDSVAIKAMVHAQLSP